MFKKYMKISISILTFCIVLFNYTYNCYAISSNVTPESWMKQLGDAVKTFAITLEAGEHLSSNALREYVKKSFDSVGFMIDETGVLIDKIKTAIHGVDNNFDDQTSDEDDIGQWIVDNTEVINGDVVFGDQYNAFIKEYNNNYVEDNKISIWYTCDVQQSTPRWLNAGFVSDFTTIEENYPNYIYTVNRFDTASVYLIGVPQSPKIYGVLAYVFDTDWEEFYFYRCNDINGVLSYEPITIRDSSLMVYEVDSQGHCTLLNDNSVVNFGYSDKTLYSYFTKQSGQSCGGDSWQQYPKTFSTNAAYIQTFTSVNALDTYIHSVGIGLQPYYYNNQVWSNFVDNSSGDYTVTTSNVNTVTYGDTVSYINDYHDTNNNYPDNSTVNNWIETTNNNNNSGGGSGGGSGGSGDDPGGSGIVSILTALGKAIADLITGIAAFLAEVVGGLVEAITGLLDTLTDLITNFTESIPNIFSPLLGWLFDGLPEEFTAIILLGLTACVIASIIKILRG